MYLKSGVFEIGLSDHFMTFIIKKLPKLKFDSHNTVTIRSMKNYSKEILCGFLNSTDWSEVFNADSPNVAWERFKRLFTDILDQVTPKKR